MKRIFFTLACLLSPISFNAQSPPCVIPARGHFQVHVGAGGLFGAFAHDHLIEAQKIEGCVKLDVKDPTMSAFKNRISNIRNPRARSFGECQRPGHGSADYGDRSSSYLGVPANYFRIHGHSSRNIRKSVSGKRKSQNPG